MTQIEIEKDNLKGLMIDGYAPSLEVLRRLDWKEVRKYLPKTEWYQRGIKRHLYEDLTEKQVIRVFRRLVYGLRENFCQFRDKRGRALSVYLLRTSGRNPFSLETRINKFYKKELEKFSQPLLVEYRHDEHEGRKLYTQNVIVLPISPLISCSRTKECYSRWINILGFDVKKENDYKNYEAFSRSWKEVLKHFIKEAYELHWFDMNQ